jgi:hypothetical protein
MNKSKKKEPTLEEKYNSLVTDYRKLAIQYNNVLSAVQQHGLDLQVFCANNKLASKA